MMEDECIGDYRVCALLGRGGFGRVYKVKRRNDNKIFALKLELEEKQKARAALENEILAYIELRGGCAIPELVDCGTHNGLRYLVIPLFRGSLRDFLESHPRFFTLRSSVVICRRLIKALRFMHGKGRLYRDMKPENIMLDFSNRIYLVDFGMSRRYVDESGKHIPKLGGKHLSGTAWYASLNTHRGIEQSRRDDLEGLLYVIILLLKSRLPWMQVEASSPREGQARIGREKNAVSIDELCSSLPGEEWWMKILQHIRGLEFEEIPNYDYLCRLLDRISGKDCLVEELDRKISPLSIWTKLAFIMKSAFSRSTR
jgi:serine/threonine protein kinase